MNGKQISDFKIESTQYKHSIIFDKATEENTGKLKVVVENEAGKDEIEMNVLIESKLLFLITLHNFFK